MKHKTESLEGGLLDAAVAKAQGLRLANHLAAPMNYSGLWTVGGPIIERERIELSSGDVKAGWSATTQYERGDRWCFGPTPLIAAMRAYVASKFGEEVDLP